MKKNNVGDNNEKLDNKVNADNCRDLRSWWIYNNEGEVDLKGTGW